MCLRIFTFLLFFLVFSSACWSQEVPDTSPGPPSLTTSLTPKQEALNLVDSLLTDNDNLKSINSDDKKLLEAQDRRLKSFEGLLKSIGLENSVLRWTAGGLLAVAVLESVLLVVRR